MLDFARVVIQLSAGPRPRDDRRASQNWVRFAEMQGLVVEVRRQSGSLTRPSAFVDSHAEPNARPASIVVNELATGRCAMSRAHREMLQLARPLDSLAKEPLFWLGHGWQFLP
jgi:hypothetical protein